MVFSHSTCCSKQNTDRHKKDVKFVKRTIAYWWEFRVNGFLTKLGVVGHVIKTSGILYIYFTQVMIAVWPKLTLKKYLSIRLL